MKKGWIVLIAVVAVLLLLFVWVKNTYNGLVTNEEGVKAAWSQVENVYQRRADLIPNLVETVKGYASHESETLEAVVSARSKATQVSVDPSALDANEIARFQQAQGELTTALGRLIALRESYPDLKANENFLNLQAQLEGTENRIAVERRKFNETARMYNTMLRRFPKNIIGSVFGFEKMPYFEADEGAQQAPKVEF